MFKVNLRLNTPIAVGVECSLIWVINCISLLETILSIFVLAHWPFLYLL